jgi:hypothetical protein
MESMDRVVACICGMHRSGTSMVAQILSRLGVYLGPEEDLHVSASDNQDGYWEDWAITAVNDEIMSHFHGGWDLPLLGEEGWENAPELSAIRDKAKRLIDQRRDRRIWGWKDPRTSITLPFWNSLIPDLKVIICLRHPWEVAQSLHRRNYISIPLGLSLWQKYQQSLMSASNSANRLITHYDSYFIESGEETQRILTFLGMETPKTFFDVLFTACKERLRNNRHREGSAHTPIPGPIMELYAEMCAQAGPIYSLKREVEIVRSQKLKIQALYEENQNLKNEIQARQCTIDQLENRLDWRLLEKIRQWPGADAITRLLRPLLRRMLSGNEAKMNGIVQRKKNSETTNKREKTRTKECMPVADGEKAENSLLSTT